MRLQYSVGMLVCITAIAALFFMQQMSVVFFVFAVEAVLIFFGVELLHRHMPVKLREARSDNCLRIDGSYSPRRNAHERRALQKVRTDLWAVLLLIVLTGNWLVFFIHSEVIPIPVAFQAVEAFDIDSQAWKQKLRDQRVDLAYEQWTVSKVPTDRQTVESNQMLLWYSWPLVILVVAVWAIGSASFLSRAYLTIVREYASGIAARAELNLNRDITRLHHEPISARLP
jgi:hypothetical protein